MTNKPESKKKYETPVIIDFGAITKGAGKACITGSPNVGGRCDTGGSPNAGFCAGGSGF